MSKQKAKKRKNIFMETDKRNGRTHYVVSLEWPDGKRFRRRHPNLKLADDMLDRINGSVVTGKWKELLNELKQDKQKSGSDPTVAEFADVYFAEYCRIRNGCPSFKQEQLKTITEIVGHVKLLEFTSADAAYFEKERAKATNRRTGEPIAKATINRGLAVLSHMFTFAIKKRLIDTHPMTRFGRLPEKEKAVRIMTLEEERRLVQSVMDENPVIGCLVGLLGETGLRKSECLRLKWEHVDLTTRTLIVEAGKTGETRYVPLSAFAIELLDKLPRFDECPFVFVWPETKQPVHDPRYHFLKGRSKAGLPKIGFHDLRRYRGTKWMMNGVDSRSTQGLLGHKYLGTTQRYAKYMGHHANQSVIEAERKEVLEVAAIFGNKLATQDVQNECKL